MHIFCFKTTYLDRFYSAYLVVLLPFYSQWRAYRIWLNLACSMDIMIIKIWACVYLRFL